MQISQLSEAVCIRANIDTDLSLYEVRALSAHS